MKKEELLFKVETISNKTLQESLQKVANSASLKTAKFYEDGISEIINNAKSSEDAIFKIGGFIYEAGKIIKELETEANYAKEK